MAVVSWLLLATMVVAAAGAVVATGGVATTTNNNHGPTIATLEATTAAGHIQANPETIRQLPAVSAAPGATKGARPDNAGLAAASADKLKRHLSNFMNQLHPAPFFVPPSQQHNQYQHQNLHHQPQVASSIEVGPNLVATLANTGSLHKPAAAAEPAAIVNGDQSPDALIKGPNRLTQSRNIGGPLRWGRRRR